jgi:hypothetical protein
VFQGCKNLIEVQRLGRDRNVMGLCNVEATNVLNSSVRDNELMRSLNTLA